jgi:amidase
MTSTAAAEVHHWSALETAAAVSRREISIAEVVEAALSRLAALDSLVGAFATPTPDLAIAAAQRLDALPTSERGPLFGVPTSIKDFVDVAGVPTRWGSPALRGNVPSMDDHTTIAIQDAGLLSLGKSNVPELGLTCFTEPRGLPPAATPYDLTRGAAGSSGGAAAAVAARIVPVAQGSDSGGSIRSPASVCGLVGLKTSRGRVSFGPMATDGLGLSVRGPLARTVRDAAAFLDVLSRRFPGDLLAPPSPAAGFLATVDDDPGPLRIALYDESPYGVATECRAAARRVADLLSELGHLVEEVPPPTDGSFAEAFIPVLAGLAAGISLPLNAEADLEPFTRSLRSLSGSATPLPMALGALQVLSRRAVAATDQYDLVLSPTLGRLPAPHGSLRHDDAMTCLTQMAAFSAFTALDNATGRPAINVPVIWTEEDLPVGVQVVADWGREDLLLQVARQLEQTAPWSHHAPDL